MNNMLVYFLAEHEEKNQLAEFLEEQEDIMENKGRVNFDLDFALNLFERKKLFVGKVYILSMMGLHEEAVSAAIQTGDYTLARKQAQKLESIEKQKKLLLPIVWDMINKKKPIKMIIEFMNEAREEMEDVLKIDDFLSKFPDDVDIRSFKNELAQTLREYNQVASNFQVEMEANAKQAEEVRGDYYRLRAAKQTIYSDEFCEVCFRSILSSEFVKFPCSHCYHRVATN